MKWISRHRWTTASVAITVIHMGTIYCAMHAYYGDGDAVVAGSPLIVKLLYFHVFSIAAGAVVGFIGALKEKPEYYAIVATILAVLSFVVFVG